MSEIILGFLLGGFGVLIGMLMGFFIAKRMYSQDYTTTVMERPVPLRKVVGNATAEQVESAIERYDEEHAEAAPMPQPPAPAPEPIDDGFKPLAEVVAAKKQPEVLYTRKGQPYMKMPDGRTRFLKKSEVAK